MLLQKIELENVKTHKHTVIPFQKGLNVLHGDNGTGKSTVLEMIGFVLFDYLKSKKHEDYVRDLHDDKAEYGTVRIWITGLDNQTYIVERTIGKTSVSVHNALNNVKLDIDGVGKLKSWIKKQLGLRPEVDLGTLFDTAIGIPQGMIVNNFLEAPKERKAYFDPILQLEIYEEVWQNLGALKGAFDPDLKALQKEINKIEGEISEKANIVTKKDKLTRDIETITTELKSNESKKDKIKKDLDKLKEIKNRLETAENESKEIVIKQESEIKTLNALQTQLTESIKAKKICDDAKSDRDDYVKYSQEFTSLSEKNNELNEKKEALSKKNEKYLEIKSKSDQINEKINEAKKASDKLKEIEPKYKKYNELETSIKEQEKQLTTIQTQEENLTKQQKNVDDLNKQVKSQKDIVSKLPEWQKRNDELTSIEQKKSIIDSEISSLKNEILLYQHNQDKIVKGVCPFSDQECKNISEGTFDSDYCNNEVKKKNESLKSKEREIELLKDKLKFKEEVQNNLEQINEANFKVKECESQIYNAKKEIDDLKSKILNKTKFLKEKEDLETQKKALKPIIDEYPSLKKNADSKPKLEQDRIPIESDLKKIEMEKNQLKRLIESLKDVPELLKKTKVIMDKSKSNYDSYQQNVKISEKLTEIENKINESNKKTNEFKAILKKKIDLIKDLKSQFNETEFARVESEKADIDSKIASQKTLLGEKKNNLEEVNDAVKKIQEKEIKLEECGKQEDKLKAQIYFIDKIRHWFREFIPKMRKALMNKINILASEIYRSIREDESALLEWTDDYDIIIKTSKTEKSLFKLSGGEKMSAALSVRLAILKALTKAEFAFFDEPTTNLDSIACNNLSIYINNIPNFNQLFVISHDDSFKRNSDYVIKFSKDDAETTKIELLTNID